MILLEGSVLVSVASVDWGDGAVSVTSFASVIATVGLFKDVAAVIAEVVDAGWLVVVVAAGSEGNLPLWVKVGNN